MKLYFESRRATYYDDELIHDIFPGDELDKLLKPVADEFKKCVSENGTNFVDHWGGQFRNGFDEKIIRDILTKNYHVYWDNYSLGYGLYIKDGNDRVYIGKLELHDPGWGGCNLRLFDNEDNALFFYEIYTKDRGWVYKPGDSSNKRVNFIVRDIMNGKEEVVYTTGG